MSGHVDDETLSAYREDLLPENEAARVAAHVSGCARCAAASAQLAAVTDLLASAPAPPMPAAVTERIQAAIAAEAAARAAAAAAGSVADAAATPAATPLAATAPHATTAPPSVAPARRRARRAGRSPAFRRLALRVAAAAAAVAVVGGAGFGLVRLATGGQPGPSTSSSTANQRAPAAVPPSGQGPRMSAPGVLGGLPLVASGTDYLPGRLAEQARAALSQRRFSSLTPAGVAASSAATAFGGARNLPACVRTVTGGVRPKLVDVARYQGRPALVIVTPAGRGAMRVWVVGTGCLSGAKDVIARTWLPAG